MIIGYARYFLHSQKLRTRRPCARLRHPPISRKIQTACTVHHESLSEGLTLAIQEASALHHGFTSNDMPAQALILIARHYFPELSADHLAQGVHSTLTKALGDDNIEVISAVVDEISPETRGMKGISLLLLSEDERARIHVFRDNVNRDISLGRAWKSQGNGNSQETLEDGWVPSGDWKTLLAGESSSDPSQSTTIAPVNDVKSALIITKAAFGALDWPAQMFPNASKYGLTPASTPFLTGRPITMTHNKSMLTNGGLALSFSRAQQQPRILHPGLKILGEPLSVTKAQGNILITLDGEPATFALLERIRAVIQKDLKISKDIQLFGRIMHKGTTARQSNDPEALIKIIAGDPGKGSIALNGGYRVAEGDQIQLFYEDNQAQDNAQQAAERLTGVTMKFHTLPADSNEGYESGTGAETTVQVLEHHFMGGSCSGIIVGGRSRTWVHESVGSVAILE